MTIYARCDICNADYKVDLNTEVKGNWFVYSNHICPQKYFISEETGSVYWLQGEAIMFAPLCRDNTFDTDGGGEVDEQMMKGEFASNGRSFEEIYAEVREALS